MASRIEQLYQFALQNPKDPFNWYALALEFKKTESAKAIEILNGLLADHEEYVPTYYQLGKLYQETGNIHDAQRIFEQGIKMATDKNDLKALHELKGALQELQFDY